MYSFTFANNVVIPEKKDDHNSPYQPTEDLELKINDM